MSKELKKGKTIEKNKKSEITRTIDYETGIIIYSNSNGGISTVAFSDVYTSFLKKKGLS